MPDQHEFKHALGTYGIDKLSDFKGTITAAAQFFTGCDRYEITPARLDDKGQPMEGHYFDSERIGSKPYPTPNQTDAKRVVDFRHELGAQVKDIVTGVEGRVMVRTAYLYSSNRYGIIKINAETNEDMKWLHFDEDQLQATNKKPLVLPKQKNSKPGGVPCRETPQR